MKKYKYCADGGCLMLGNALFTCHYPNGYGDGEFYVFVNNNPKFDATCKAHYVGSVEGKINVYADDCSTDTVLCQLEGRYGVFADCGTMYLEKWA